MQEPQFDVAIVGASISGASLANYLGRERLKVALIDKEKFPRRKACGEGVSDIALDSLYRLGLKEDIQSLDGLPFHAYRLDFDNRSIEFASGKDRYLKGIGIQRYLLDKTLNDKAAAFPSVAPFLETTVRRIERNRDEHFSVEFSSGETITAHYLALACGVNPRKPTRLGIPHTKEKPGRWGISFSLQGRFQEKSREVLVMLKDGFEVYCTPVSETVLNVAFLASKEKVAYLQDDEVRDGLLSEAMGKCSFAGELLDAPLITGPLGATRRPYRHGSILLLGDVAESFDPISGMGITHGVLSAELAAQALIAIRKNNAPAEKALDEYAINCERMARLYRGFTRLTGGLLRSRLRNVLIPLLVKTRLPFLIRKSLKYQPPDEAPAASIFLSLLRLIGK